MATKSLCAVLVIVALVYVASGKAPSIPSIAWPSINWPTIFAPSTPSVPVTPAPSTVTSVTYVYEKDATPIPSEVMAGLNRVNRERNILATVFEVDTTDGEGQIPEQYKLAVAAAKEKGLPCLVVMAGEKVASVTKPTTAEQVVEAAK